MNTVLWILGAIALYLAVGSLAGKGLKRSGEQYPTAPPVVEDYPGELAHLRDLLLAVCRHANTCEQATELLIDHYSDSRLSDAHRATGGDPR